MRIRTIGVVSVMAAIALLAGVDTAQAKSVKKHSGKGHCTVSKKMSCQDKNCDLSACAKKGCNHAGEAIYKKGNSKTELALMKQAGMCNVLCGKGPITVFCPTDEAYSKLGKARLDDIKKDPKKLAALLKYHIINKKVMVADIKAKGGLVTSQGDALMTNTNNGKAEVDGCIIIEPDVICKNGVIQFIDDVPVPERGK